MPNAFQLKLKAASIAVETRFMTPMNRGAYFWRAVPALATLAVLFASSALPPAVARVLGWFAVPLFLLAGWFFIEASARRYRDLGKKGVSVLKIVIPLFVCAWLTPKIQPEFALVRNALAVLLCAGPLVAFFGLLFRASRSSL